MTTLETKTDSAAETGKNLHAWLLKMILVCSKKYTMTYYCRFQCGNCVIMPTGHECIRPRLLNLHIYRYMLALTLTQPLL